MDRLISEKAVLDILKNGKKYGERYYSMSQLIEIIKAIPAAELKTGYWVKTPKAVMGEGYMWYCDKCGHQVYQDSSRPYPSQKYCPDCGCRMILPFA